MKKNIFVLMVTVFSWTVAGAQNLVAGIPIGSGPIASPNMLSIACDTIFSFPTNASWSTGLASDGANLWTTSNNSDYLLKFSPAGVLLDTLSVPDTTGVGYFGGDLEFDGTNLLFVRENTGILYKINPVTKTIVSQILLPQYGMSDPNDYGVAFDGTCIWHTSYSPASMLYKMNATTGNVISSFVLSTSSVLPIKFINGNLYGISLSNNSLVQIDTSNGNTVNTIPWCLNYSLGLAQLNGNVWGLASTSIDRIYKFDTLLTTSVFNQMISNPDFYFENPANEKLILKFRNGFTEIKSLEIIDEQGRVVITKKVIANRGEAELDVSNLFSGIYLLKMSIGSNHFVRKLIKL